MHGKGIFDRIIDSMAFLAGILLVGAVLIVCLEICMRYFFLKPQVWTVEVCEYILFIMTFLATPWLLKKGGHVGVDILVEHMAPRVQGFMGMFSCLAGLLVSGIIVWFSGATAWDCYENGIVVTKTLTLPKFYFLALISLGYLLLLGEFARQGLKHFKRLKEKR
jgi:TRAP-type C4-dicarboxylate transport system permease small subunit